MVCVCIGLEMRVGVVCVCVCEGVLYTQKHTLINPCTNECMYVKVNASVM